MPGEDADMAETMGGDAMRRSIFAARSAPARHMPARPTRTPTAGPFKGPGMEAKLCFIGHGLMENRSGLIVDARLYRQCLGPCRAIWRRST